MSCPHGNHVDACDICDEVAAAYNSGVEHTKLAEIEAQPEQEPYGYFKPEPFGWVDCEETDEGAIPLYEKPYTMHQPLTEEVLYEMLYEKDWIQFARAIEAAHGIKEAK